MWHVFIEFGGMFFWILVAVAVLAELAFVSRNMLGAAFTVLGVFATVMVLFSSVPVLGFIAGSWQSILWWLAAYVGAGAAWAIVRWVMYALKRKRFFYDKRDAWYDFNKGMAGLPSKSIVTWDDRAKLLFFSSFVDDWNRSEFRKDESWSRLDLGERGRSDRDDKELAEKHAKKVFDEVVPKARYNKSKISAWLCFWPFSIVCYFLEDMVTDLIRWVVRWLVKAATAINAALFAGMKKELGA